MKYYPIKTQLPKVLRNLKAHLKKKKYTKNKHKHILSFFVTTMGVGGFETYSFMWKIPGGAN